MDIKKIFIILIIILSLILGGVIYYSVTSDTEQDEQDPINESTNETEDEFNPILPNHSLNSIEERENYTLDIDIDELINDHESTVLENNVNIEQIDEDSTTTIRTDDTSVEKIIDPIFGTTEKQYSNNSEDITYIKNNLYDGIRYDYKLENFDITEQISSTKITTIINYIPIQTYDYNEEDDSIIVILETDSPSDNLSSSLSYLEPDKISVELQISIEHGHIKHINSQIIGEDAEGVSNVDDFEQNIELTNNNIAEPSWLTELKEETTILSQTYSPEQGLALIEHKGLATIPEHTTIELYDLENERSRNIQLPSDFEEGDILGLQFTGNDVNVSLNEELDEGDNLEEHEGYVIVFGSEPEYSTIELLP